MKTGKSKEISVKLTSCSQNVSSVWADASILTGTMQE
jgi:hypothetical protein